MMMLVVLVCFTAHILPHAANLLPKTANLQFSAAELQECALEHAQMGLRIFSFCPKRTKPTTTPRLLSNPKVNAARVPHLEPLGYADGLLDRQQETLVGFAGEDRGFPFT